MQRKSCAYFNHAETAEAAEETAQPVQEFGGDGAPVDAAKQDEEAGADANSEPEEMQ